MLHLTAPRLSNPRQRVTIEFQDHGCSVPAFREDGRQFAAYTSEFRIGDRVVFVQVPRDDPAVLAAPEAERVRQDELALLGLDADITDWSKVEILADRC